jgi:hypothetical protein
VKDTIMKLTLRPIVAFGMLLMLAAPVAGEELAPEHAATAGAAAIAVLLDGSQAVTSYAAVEATEAPAPAEAAPPTVKARPIVMQYFRALDQRGLNVFETPKEPGVEHTGFKLDWGAAFASQVQALDHENTAVPVMMTNTTTGQPYDANQLADIGFGFNNSTANLYLHAQLARGIRVQLTSYLSSRHHNETWVKDGFILIDESPLDMPLLNSLMQYVTVKVGHMEINYGDAHFRRSDNGNALYNPFVGNYILDAFTTEIGGEVYLRAKGLIAMGSVTGGEIRGTVLTPERRGPTFIGKLGFDRQVKPDLRVRLTGSVYRAAKVMSNTLYGGDRAGSRYYYVLENTQATESANFTSGLINPGFRNSVTAVQINPFVKYRGLELFGVIERAEGKAASETTKRDFNQYALDLVYRLPGEKLFAGVRYNKVEGQLVGIANDVGADRWQLGGGWFILPGLLAKAEYVTQEFKGYPPTNIKNGGKFHGLMLEGVVAF